jgi:ABC-type Fe3+ transport system permease subunit
MHLLYEDLARAQIADRLEEAARLRRANRLRTARRLTRRAERASLRARRALAVASIQP